MSAAPGSRLLFTFAMHVHLRVFIVVAMLAAFFRSATGQTIYAPAEQPPHAVFDAGNQVVRLSNPSEPIQFTVVPQPVPVGPSPFGTPLAVQFGEPWSWQLLPEGLIYRSYLAGVREPRLSVIPFYEFDRNAWLLDATIGARVGLLRYGNEAHIRPEGFQIDLEAAAFPRLDPESEMDLVATDFRVGVPFTWGNELYQVKVAYYHLSSHIADEFLLVTPAFPRLNFSRDAIVLGNSVYLTSDLRVYAEVGYGYYTDGGSEPWEFQFGIDYSPLLPQARCGAPFLAFNGHLREEVNFGGNFVAQAGWQWRGKFTERLLRLGVHYLTGPSPQYEFFADSEEQLGVGLWYDF